VTTLRCRRRGTAVAAALAAFLWCAPAAAIQCKIVVVQTMNFGLYMPATTDPVDVIGQLTVRCQAQPGTFSVGIGPGLSGDQTARTLSSGGSTPLYYNLFRDPAMTEIWGDGTPPTFVATGRRTTQGRPTFFDFPIYGRIFANQAPDAGVYNDSLLVTVLF